PRLHPDQPTLAEMTRKAIELLARNPEGFFLMVEGSQIDARCHANDAPGALHEVLALDDAVDLALAFARQNPATLVLVTADHETGGMVFAPTAVQLAALENVTAPLSGSAFRDGMTAAELLETARAQFGVELKESEVRELLGEAGVYEKKTHAVPLARLVSQRYGVLWATTGHSAAPVYLIAYGPGSEGVRGMQENTAVFNVMRQALGLE
ncbi:MAG: alkaline phosphatase, partial [Armatimonadota bacterium]|nr:alkaline phosphatase [Armatimonadota bacterium]